MIASAGKSIPLLASVIFLLAITLAGILAPIVAPHSPTRGSLRERNVPPAWLEGGSRAHLLGTDHLGRDLLSRFIHGARNMLLVTLVPILVAGIVGGGLGLIAGCLGGPVYGPEIRLADFPLVLLAIFPVLLAQFPMPLAMALVLVSGPSLKVLAVLIALLPGVIFAHQVWRETLRIKEAARGTGTTSFPTLVRHLLPGALRPLVILAPLMMVYAIVLEGSLSSLGSGVPPPTPAWGSMLADGRDRLTVAWWISTFPALAILLTVFSLALLASQLREQLDPRPNME